MKKKSLNESINIARAKVDIADELLQKINGINEYEMHTDEDLTDWQIDANERSLAKIAVLESIIASLIG